MVSKQAALADLLIELYSSSEDIHRLIVRSPSLQVLRAELPDGTLSKVAHALVELLQRRGLADSQFFCKLLEERPRAAARIKLVARLWGIEIEIEIALDEHRQTDAPGSTARSGSTEHRSALLAFIFGSVFVVVLLVVAIMLPRWTPEQAFVFRVVLALSAAGVGAVLPGLFVVQARWASVGLRAGGAVGLFAVVFFMTPSPPGVTETLPGQPRVDDSPPPSTVALSSWNLRSEDKLAEGLAVDTDPLELSWRASGEPVDLEVWLENVQTRRASRVLRTSSDQHGVAFTREDYVEILASRAPGTVNRVRATATAPGLRVVSPEFDLHVGLTILLASDRSNMLSLSALIDNSTEAVPRYAFKGTLVQMIVGDPKSGQGSVSQTVADGWFKNPAAEVSLTDVKVDPKFWQSLYFIYEEPGDSRCVRTQKMFAPELTEEKVHE